MDTKQIEITCPCCSTRILLDVRTEKVLRTLRPEEHDSTGKPLVSEKDWQGALGRVQERERTREDKLDQAFGRERDKGRSLDDLFREAHDKARRDPEEPR